ncbi:TPA: pyridoxine 5'-phosphate synthase [Candidatus Poribacteria bacterium]|nr:pyridoxine 5'-phosphate synthase [Candidatus Poribacteria bacterium]
MPRLGVNIDHVATIREARKTIYPDPIAAAVIVELAGADGIVVHLREDRRHIQDRDLRLLRQIVQTPLNLEMAASDEIIEIALEVKPNKVTLVPERREEITTEGGLDVVSNERRIAECVKRLNSGGIPVSMFIEADSEQIKCSKRVGAEAVEFHTGTYCDAPTEALRNSEFERLKEASKETQEIGLIVHMGHGLNYHNVVPIAQIDGVDELNIGHSIIARAVFVGLDKAVREMLALIK